MSESQPEKIDGYCTCRSFPEYENVPDCGIKAHRDDARARRQEAPDA